MKEGDDQGRVELEQEEEEEEFLCQLFGTESRFVEFVNLTGRDL